MISNEYKISSALKSYKHLYEIFIPLLKTLAVICAVLCCFRSKEGSNSRLICAILLTCFVVIIVIMTAIHNNLNRKQISYRTYQCKLAKKLNLKVLLPLCIMVVITALPFYILVVTSLKNPMEANNVVFTWWPTEGIDLESFKELFAYESIIGVTMIEAIINSFIYAIIPTFIGVFVSAISAYAFTKLSFKGKDMLYQLLIMTVMMPGCVTMTTAYIMYDWYGWTGSALPLIVPGCFGGASIVMFLREYFMGIPDGMLEAAKIDGAGTWEIFFRIMLPLGKPALTAQLILGFITSYNNYVAPLIYLNEPKKYTIQIALAFLNDSVPDKTLVATAGVFSLAPMLLLYIIFQKRIINGISMSSGLKG